MEETEKGCVYFFRHIGLSPIKIGYSENESPSFRFEQFKTYAPFGAELIGFIRTENAKSLETELHKKYSRDRIKGEWFEISKEEAEKCIKFHSNILDIEEMNRFQIIWAKSLNRYSNEENIKEVEENFFANYSLYKKNGFDKVITNQSEISSFLNIDKSEIKKLLKKLEVYSKTRRCDGVFKNGVLLYKKVDLA